jgi:hypothetical protein
MRFEYLYKMSIENNYESQSSINVMLKNIIEIEKRKQENKKQ